MRSATSSNQLFLFFITIISLTSCFTPQKVIKMESDSGQDTKWNYGREVVVVRNGDLEARVFFEDFTKKDLIFDVEVTNMGNEEILLKPEEIYIQTDNGGNLWSYDPEKEIFGEQMEASRQEARNKNAAVAVGVAVVATAVAVAATSDGDNSGNDGDVNFFDGGDTFVYVNTAVPPPPMEFQPPNLNFWKDYSLRKTTLEKGYKVGGKVVFPRMDNARTYTVVVPVDGVELRASFRQRIYQP
ncbi:MAG: hypothetical protein AAFZ15_13320 [Bacteroidota bacterium]